MITIIFSLVYIVGAVLSYMWMDDNLPNESPDDKIPYILWSLLWPVVWTLEMHNNIHNN